ncbi:MAG: hypothetical protein LBC95_03120 [Candidatus Nomurabacteria bacterium]|jgi:hypothetical protein|nr:hypothetical protein [Candidatus Nomurabacteria bacterium]
MDKKEQIISAPGRYDKYVTDYMSEAAKNPSAYTESREQNLATLALNAMKTRPPDTCNQLMEELEKEIPVLLGKDFDPEKAARIIKRCYDEFMMTRPRKNASPNHAARVRLAFDENRIIPGDLIWNPEETGEEDAQRLEIAGERDLIWDDKLYQLKKPWVNAMNIMLMARRKPLSIQEIKELAIKHRIISADKQYYFQTVADKVFSTFRADGKKLFDEFTSDKDSPPHYQLSKDIVVSDERSLG